MDRFYFIKIVVAALSTVLTATSICVAEHHTSAGGGDGSSEARLKPNIIFVLVDDMGYGDLAAHGNPLIKTPHMDQIHKESVRFANFCVSPTCAPTRAALMSGKHEFKVGVTHTIPGRNTMDLKIVTVADLFHKAGYKTGLFGKWHLGTEGGYRPEKRGFDVALTAIDDTQKHPFDPTLLRNGKQEKYTGYRTDIFFREAMRFIEENKENPFFCYIPTYSPHQPLKVPEKYSKMYPGTPSKTANFLGMVSNVDHNIGLLRKKIDSLGLTSNTIIVLMNDNGGTNGVDVWNAGMRGRKAQALLGGIRALSFWCWPGKWKPADHNQVTGSVDVLPTFAKIAGINLDDKFKASLDGKSLLPLIENDPNPKNSVDWGMRMMPHHRGRWSATEGNTLQQDAAAHRYSYCSLRWKHYIIVRAEICPNKKCTTCQRVLNRSNPNYKVTAAYTSNLDHYIRPEGKWKLYDLKSDLFQSKDITNDQPEIAQRMIKQYDRWWKDVWNHPGITP